MIYIINSKNISRVAPSLIGSFDDGRRFPHRWWFDEKYRYGSGENGGYVLSDFLHTIVDPTRWRGAVDYFLYRQIKNPIGSTDAYIYYDKSLPLDALP